MSSGEKLYERFIGGDTMTVAELKALRQWLMRQHIAAKVDGDSHEVELRYSDIQYVDQEIEELTGRVE